MAYKWFPDKTVPRSLSHLASVRFADLALLISLAKEPGKIYADASFIAKPGTVMFDAALIPVANVFNPLPNAVLEYLYFLGRAAAVSLAAMGIPM